jgi:hypothetical protein
MVTVLTIRHAHKSMNGWPPPLSASRAFVRRFGGRSDGKRDGTQNHRKAYYDHEAMARYLALLLAFAMGQTGAAPRVTARDTDGNAWTLLTPDANQLELLFFISSDCPISNHYAPEIMRICSDYRAHGVRCFTVYPDDDVTTVTSHRREFGYGPAIPAFVDHNYALVKAAGAHVTPQAVLYSPAGRVYSGRIDDLYIDAGRTRRQATRHDLRLALDAAVAGQRVAHPETDPVGCFIPAP